MIGNTSPMPENWQITQQEGNVVLPSDRLEPRTNQPLPKNSTDEPSHPGKQQGATGTKTTAAAGGGLKRVLQRKSPSHPPLARGKSMAEFIEAPEKPVGGAKKQELQGELKKAQDALKELKNPISDSEQNRVASSYVRKGCSSTEQALQTIDAEIALAKMSSELDQIAEKLSKKIVIGRKNLEEQKATLEAKKTELEKQVGTPQDMNRLLERKTLIEKNPGLIEKANQFNEQVVELEKAARLIQGQIDRLDKADTRPVLLVDYALDYSQKDLGLTTDHELFASQGVKQSPDGSCSLTHASSTPENDYRRQYGSNFAKGLNMDRGAFLTRPDRSNCACLFDGSSSGGMRSTIAAQLFSDSCIGTLERPRQNQGPLTHQEAVKLFSSCLSSAQRLMPNSPQGEATALFVDCQDTGQRSQATGKRLFTAHVGALGDSAAFHISQDGKTAQLNTITRREGSGGIPDASDAGGCLGVASGLLESDVKKMSVHSTEVAEDDVLVLVSDGLMDNIVDNDVVAFVARCPLFDGPIDALLSRDRPWETNDLRFEAGKLVLPTQHHHLPSRAELEAFAGKLPEKQEPLTCEVVQKRLSNYVQLVTARKHDIQNKLYEKFSHDDQNLFAFSHSWDQLTEAIEHKNLVLTKLEGFSDDKFREYSELKEKADRFYTKANQQEKKAAQTALNDWLKVNVPPGHEKLLNQLFELDGIIGKHKKIIEQCTQNVPREILLQQLAPGKTDDCMIIALNPVAK